MEKLITNPVELKSWKFSFLGTVWSEIFHLWEVLSPTSTCKLHLHLRKLVIKPKSNHPLCSLEVECRWRHLTNPWGSTLDNLKGQKLRLNTQVILDQGKSNYNIIFATIFFVDIFNREKPGGYWILFYCTKGVIYSKVSIISTVWFLTENSDLAVLGVPMSWANS